MSGPIPKPARRIRNRDVFRELHLELDECAACGKPKESLHHVVPKGSPHFGDDVRENLLGLCGCGTTGCHGAYHAGDLETREAIGAALAMRPDMIRYVLTKMGDEAGRDYLRRRYLVEA